jgi:ABC-type transport system substrate-binding protein
MVRIAEPGPALLSLTKGEIDFLTVRQPALAFDGTALKPELQARRIRAVRGAGEGMYLLMFNMRDPVVGGFAPPQVALRRAIAMSIDDAAWLQVFDRGLGRVRQHVIGPSVIGHDPAYRNPNRHDPATASALLDRTGYARGPDDYRRAPDGRDLELRMIIGTTSLSRELAEFLKRAFDQLGLRVVFDAMPVGDRLKRMSTCQYQMTTMSFGGGAPDGVSAMENFYSPHIGTVNLACYGHDAYDQAYERLRVMPLDAARAPVFRELTALIDAHAPSRVLPMADTIYLLAPKLRGYVLNDYVPYPIHLLDIAESAPARP